MTLKWPLTPKEKMAPKFFWISRPSRHRKTLVPKINIQIPVNIYISDITMITACTNHYNCIVHKYDNEKLTATLVRLSPCFICWLYPGPCTGGGEGEKGHAPPPTRAADFQDILAISRGEPQEPPYLSKFTSWPPPPRGEPQEPPYLSKFTS